MVLTIAISYESFLVTNAIAEIWKDIAANKSNVEKKNMSQLIKQALTDSWARLPKIIYWD